MAAFPVPRRMDGPGPCCEFAGLALQICICNHKLLWRPPALRGWLGLHVRPSPHVLPHAVRRLCQSPAAASDEAGISWCALAPGGGAMHFALVREAVRLRFAVTCLAGTAAADRGCRGMSLRSRLAVYATRNRRQDQGANTLILDAVAAGAPGDYGDTQARRCRLRPHNAPGEVPPKGHVDLRTDAHRGSSAPRLDAGVCYQTNGCGPKPG